MSAISPLLKLLRHVHDDSTLEFTGINETIFSPMFEKQHELLTTCSETEKNHGC
jgi:hypothetical protein